MNQLSVWMRFKREDRITVIFCGSKKIAGSGCRDGKGLIPRSGNFGSGFAPVDALPRASAFGWKYNRESNGEKRGLDNLIVQ